MTAGTKPCILSKSICIGFSWSSLKSNLGIGFSEFVRKSKKPAGRIVRQRAWISYDYLAIRAPPPTRSSHGDGGDGDGSAKSFHTDTRAAEMPLSIGFCPDSQPAADLTSGI